MYAKTLASTPTLHNSKAGEHIKAVGIDEPTARVELEGNVTEVDGGILEYVRERMRCKTITAEVRHEAAVFEREMNRMQGW